MLRSRRSLRYGGAFAIVVTSTVCYLVCEVEIGFFTDVFKLYNSCMTNNKTPPQRGFQRIHAECGEKLIAF